MGEKHMKNYILGALIALCWAMPLMGVTVRNTTEKTVTVTASSGDQKSIFGTVSVAAHNGNAVALKESVPQLHLAINSIVPAHKQMTPIEPLKGSRGWLFIGRNQEGHELYTPLLSHTEIEKPLEGASPSYALIDGKITRIDSFAESKNTTDQYNGALSPAAYIKDIDPKSYIMVVRDKKLIAKLYAPQVVRAAAAQWYKAKNK
jgi:hypothetical protein